MGGKVSVFCFLSGCTPESAQALTEVFGSIKSATGPLVLDAVHAIMSNDEREGQQDVTVIGDISESGEARSKIEPLAKDVALQVPDSSIRIIPRCRMGDGWYYGRVTCPDSTREYLVSYGTNIMVQSASLPILHRATGGRMTAQRLWRLAMWQGFSEGKRVHAMFDSIDYGEVMEGVGQNILITPGIDDLTGLEELGDVELIKTAITHEGKFWIWMRPDRFPSRSTGSAKLIHTGPPSDYHSHSTFERLPFELVSQIAHDLPLPSLLSLVSTSHHIRFKFLGHVSDRDTLARSWIAKNAPWYIPDEIPDSGANDVITWAYLKGCLGSGSMRNRRRIWRIAEQLGQMADGIGI